jgi:hypothetical protein
MSYKMLNDDSDTISGKELNQITKVAYRPEKNKDCLVVWQSIGDVLFERSYYYSNYDDAKEDFMNIKTNVEMMVKSSLLKTEGN